MKFENRDRFYMFSYLTIYTLCFVWLKIVIVIITLVVTIYAKSNLGGNVPIFTDVTYLVCGEARPPGGWKSVNAADFPGGKKVKIYSKNMSKVQNWYHNLGGSGEMVICILLGFSAVMHSNWIAVVRTNKQSNPDNHLKI